MCFHPSDPNATTWSSDEHLRVEQQVSDVSAAARRRTRLRHFHSPQLAPPPPPVPDFPRGSTLGEQAGAAEVVAAGGRHRAAQNLPAQPATELCTRACRLSTHPLIQIQVSGFRIQNSGFRFHIPLRSRFWWLPGFRLAPGVPPGTFLLQGGSLVQPHFSSSDWPPSPLASAQYKDCKCHSRMEAGPTFQSQAGAPSLSVKSMPPFSSGRFGRSRGRSPCASLPPSTRHPPSATQPQEPPCEQRWLSLPHLATFSPRPRCRVVVAAHKQVAAHKVALHPLAHGGM